MGTSCRRVRSLALKLSIRRPLEMESLDAIFCVRSEDMEKRSYLKEFTNYTFLSVLGTLGVSCYILADTFLFPKALVPMD